MVTYVSKISALLWGLHKNQLSMAIETIEDENKEEKRREVDLRL